MKKLSEGAKDQMKMHSNSLLRKEHLKILNEWQNNLDQVNLHTLDYKNQNQFRQVQHTF